MRVLTPPEIQPTVKVVGYREVRPEFRLGPRHLHHPDLVYLARGRFGVQIGAHEEFPLRAGDVLFIHPREEHAFHRTTRRRTVVAYVHTEPLLGHKWEDKTYRLVPEPKRVVHTRGDVALRDLFRRAEEVYSGFGRYQEAILQTIVREIWLRLAEYWSGRGEPQVSVRMREMLRFLRRHLTEAVGRAELAAEFHITPEHVNYLFKQELGISPTAFVNRERVRRAHQAIREEGISVKEAAARFGFQDPFYFSRTFKKVTGMSPSDVR